MKTKKSEDLSFLIEGVKSFDINETRTSYNKLYKTFKAGIVYYVGQFTDDEGHIQDIVSETFAKAFSNMAMYKKQKSQFSTWIYSIARNTAIDWIRKGWIKKNNQFALSNLLKDQLSENFATDYSNPLDKIGLSLFLSQVEKEIFLSQNKTIQKIFQLYIDGLHYEEISKETNLPLGTVKMHIFRVKMHLKEKFISYRDELCPSFS